MGNVNRQSYATKRYIQAMSTFGERLREARGDKGLSQAALARLVGVKQPTIAELESQGKGSSKTPLLAKALGVNPIWLSEGKGSKQEPASSLVVHSFEKKQEGLLTISQYVGVGGSMGRGVLLEDQPGQITSWEVTQEWLSKNIPANTGAKNLAIVTGFGDSMKGKFNPGDPIVIDTGIRECKHDGMYFFRVGDEGFIKTLQRIPGQGIRVISENKAYESWTITPDMDFHVLGKVLKLWVSSEY